MTTVPVPFSDWSDDSKVTSVVDAVHTAGWSRWSPGDADDTVLRTMRTGLPRLESDVVAEIEHAASPAGPTRPRFRYGPQSRYGPRAHPAHEALLREQERLVGRHNARLLDLARPWGLGSLDSSVARVDFLIAAGVLCRITGRAGVYLVPAWPVPLPQERLALTLDERITEDKLRWNDLFEDAGDKIIWMFRPEDDDRLPALNTSLHRIARRWTLDGETVRCALLILLDGADFTATADLTRLDADTLFHLTVDWNTFDATRIVVEP